MVNATTRVAFERRWRGQLRVVSGGRADPDGQLGPYWSTAAGGDSAEADGE